MKSRGKFIVLEGIDGVGTTSMTREIRDHFSLHGFAIQSTKEPYSTELEMLLRRFITGEFQDPGWRPMSLLFTADRLIHCRDLDEVLAGGMSIVSDRYVGSTAAYQSALASVEEQEIALNYIMNSLGEGLLLPDLIIYLRGSVDICRDRMLRSRSVEDHYERIGFQHRVADMYERWVRREIQRNDDTLIVAVDADRPYGEVRADCLLAVNMIFGNGCGLGVIEDGANSSACGYREIDGGKADCTS